MKQRYGVFTSGNRCVAVLDDFDAANRKAMWGVFDEGKPWEVSPVHERHRGVFRRADASTHIARVWDRYKQEYAAKHRRRRIPEGEPR